MALELLGRKVQMGNVFNDDGTRIPVTFVELIPLTVTQVKTKKKDGYNAIQVGYDRVAGHKLSRPEVGHQKSIGGKPFKHLTEMRLDDVTGFEVNSLLGYDLVKVGDKVNVVGKSKGMGFAGGMKRHNFRGQGRSHGVSQVHRKPMSAGATDAARVFKGTRKPGHMGDARVTVKNLEIALIDEPTRIIAIKGAVPGPSGALIRILPR